MVRLTREELLRYQRQILIPGWSEEGQRKLKETRIGVVGTGGLGCSVLIQLAAAGFGSIVLVDRDVVELTNLNRQVLHWQPDLGRRKTESAAEKLRMLNPEVQLEAVQTDLSAENIDEVFSGVEAVVDGLDNFPGRYLVNAFAVRRGIPFFHGAVWGLEGRVLTVLPGRSACLECLYPRPQSVGASRADVEEPTPVAGVSPAVVAALQVTEAIKHFTGMGELLAGQLLIYDGLSMSFLKVEVQRSRDCPACGSACPAVG